MRVRALAAISLVAAALAPTAAASAPGFQLRHVDTAGYPTVRLVVRGPAGSAAPNVYENGEPVVLTTRQNLGRSKALVLAIDRSQSMNARALSAAGDAAGELLQRKRPSDEVAVVTFASQAQTETGFSQATIDSETALRALTTDDLPGTALYDAVRLSSQRLAAQPLAGRVLVLLTDGRDVGSKATLGEAIRAARRAGVVIYTLGYGNADPGPLRRLASATAGRFFPSPTLSTLRAIYRRVASELDRTWTISYDTAARPGDRISLAVGTNRAHRGAATSIVLPGSAPTTGGSALPHFLLTTAGTLLVSLLAGLALLGIVLLMQTMPRAERIKRRVWEHTELRQPSRRRRRRRLPNTQAFLTGLDTRLRSLPQWTNLARLVQRSGLPVPPSTLVVAALVSGLLLALVGGLAGGAFLAVLLLAVGLALPLLLLRVLAARRLQAFDNQLPDLLTTLASTLRAGHGLRAALQTVADEGAPPASIELRRVLAEARLGRPLDEALVSMCERLGWDDLLYVATAVQVQSQVGGSLAGVFTTVADTVRLRQQHRRRIRALTASGRSTAMILAILPFAFAALITLVSPHYMLPFLESHTGHVLVVASLVSISIGWLLLKRIVNIKA